MVQAHIQHAENGHLGNEQPLVSSCQASEIEGYGKVINDNVVDEICKKWRLQYPPCRLSMELSMPVL
jgi:hypothetical protein